MEIKTYQARMRRVSDTGGIATRACCFAATVMIAVISLVGSGVEAGVGGVPEDQIAHQILTVQGQDILARMSLDAPVVDLPMVFAGKTYAPVGITPQLVAANTINVPRVDAKARMAERTLHVQTMTRTASLPKPRGRAQWQCLAEALYFEARSESPEGQRAVAEVILNRVASRKYPNTVCQVVAQGADRLHACQFSYNCDGLPERISEPGAFARIKTLARAIVASDERSLTDGATHYHTVAVSPDWSRRLTLTARIGQHIFYRDNTVLSSR